MQLLDPHPHNNRHGTHKPSISFTGARILTLVLEVLTGILRHYATILLQSTPKKQELKAIREQYAFILRVASCKA